MASHSIKSLEENMARFVSAYEMNRGCRPERIWLFEEDHDAWVKARGPTFAGIPLVTAGIFTDPVPEADPEPSYEDLNSKPRPQDPDTSSEGPVEETEAEGPAHSGP